MKRHHFNLLSFFFVVGLMIAAVLATYVAVSGGTGGFMTRAAEKEKFNCGLVTSRGEAFCKTKKLCKWRAIGNKTGVCESKLAVPSSKCDALNDVCCTRAISKQGYCKGSVTCDPVTYNCVAAQTSLGQQRGEKGTCSLQFTGATCKWRSDCAKQTPIGVSKPGYCKGPVEWQCCVPYSAGN